MRPIQVGSTRHSSSTDEGSLDQYLREISRYPLITQSEEVTLAQRIRVNDEDALDKLESFASINGALFYDLGVNEETVTLERWSVEVPQEIDGIVPFHAGETLRWRLLA